MENIPFEIEHVVKRLDYPAPAPFEQKIANFLNAELRAKANYSIIQEYPALFGDFPGGQSLFIEKDGQIASHVGFVVREFEHPHFRMRIGLVGSVATAIQFRGLGMASLLMRQTFQELKRRGCALGILWSDNPDFYLPLGFYKSGRERDLKFDPQIIVQSAVVARPINLEKDIESIWRLYRRHSVKLDRSLEEMKRLCRIPLTEVFVTEREGQIVSYIAINKGADFTGYIHEWGGELPDVQANIRHCQKYFYPTKPLVLIAPVSYPLGDLLQVSSETWTGILGLVKVIDRTALLGTYMNFLHKEHIAFQWDKEKELFRVEGKEYSLKTDQEVLSLILGNIESSRKSLLPFFLWGFDSI